MSPRRESPWPIIHRFPAGKKLAWFAQTRPPCLSRTERVSAHHPWRGCHTKSAVASTAVAELFGCTDLRLILPGCVSQNFPYHLSKPGGFLTRWCVPEFILT